MGAGEINATYFIDSSSNKDTWFARQFKTTRVLCVFYVSLSTKVSIPVQTGKVRQTPSTVSYQGHNLSGLNRRATYGLKVRICEAAIDAPLLIIETGL